MPGRTFYRVPDKVLVAQLRRTLAELADQDLVRAAYDLIGWDAVAFTATLQVTFEQFDRAFLARDLAEAAAADARDAVAGVVQSGALAWLTALDIRVRTMTRVARLRGGTFDAQLPRIRTRADRPETVVRQFRLLRPELERLRPLISASPIDPFIDQGAALSAELDAADLRLDAARAHERATVAALTAAREALVTAMVELDGWAAAATQAGAALVLGDDRQVIRQWLATRPAAAAER